MTTAPAPSDMLTELSACAHRLGMAVGARAEATADWAEKLALIQVFDRCFFSVRVAIALQLRLGRDATSEAARDAMDTARAEGLEIERAERLDASAAPRPDERERDRDREDERASLPLLLSTLSGVARDVGALPAPAPAALPTLRELLARVGAAPTPAGVRSRPATPSAAPLRARLSASAGVTLAIPPGPSLVPPLRRATGPPRR